MSNAYPNKKDIYLSSFFNNLKTIVSELNEMVLKLEEMRYVQQLHLSEHTNEYGLYESKANDTVSVYTARAKHATTTTSEYTTNDDFR